MELKTERIYFIEAWRHTSVTLNAREILESFVRGPNPYEPEGRWARDLELGNHPGWHLVFTTKAPADCGSGIEQVAPEVGCDFPTQELADRFHVRLFAGDDPAVGAPFIDLRAAVETFLMEQALIGRWTPPEGDPQWEPYRRLLPASRRGSS